MKKREKVIGSIILIIIITIFVFIGYYVSNRNYISKDDAESMFVDAPNEVKESDKDINDNDSADIQDKDSTDNEDITIVVEVKGQVNKPGVYKMKKGSIIDDLINIAGGLTDESNIDNINRAEELKNNECIVIPKKGDEDKNLGVDGSDSTDFSGGNNFKGKNDDSKNTNEKIDINSADSKTLQILPGIGPSKGDAIIQYRQKNGKFKNIEDIKNVSGIGDSTFENIKEKIVAK